MTAPVGCLDERILRALRMADMQLSAWENGYAFDTHGPSREAQRLVTDALAALSASRQEGWISVDERLPGPGVIVLAFFRNSYGKGRVVRAHHAPKHTIEAGHWDEDAETDNTDDGSFEPEGWYEDPAVGETLSFISPESDGAVSHWRPMPAAPQEAQGDRHGE